MRERLLEYLDKNNIKGDIHKDIVSFRSDGLNFVCQFYDDDPYYFRLMLPRIDKKDSDSLQQITSSINLRFKVAKLIDVGGEPWLVAESFVYSSENGELLIARLVRLLTDVYNYYYMQMRQTNAE